MDNTEQDDCTACGGNGWLLMMNADSAALELQRCDTCCKYNSDEETQQAFVSNVTMLVQVLFDYIEALCSEAKRAVGEAKTTKASATRALKTIRDSLENAMTLVSMHKCVFPESHSISAQDSPATHPSEEEQPMKKTYLIGVREIHARFYGVQAENSEQAKALVKDRAPEVVNIEFEEYSNELDADTWSVEEKP